MSIPLLVGGGADCGPSNPLQGLAKQFDKDRGIQQDQFKAPRAGSSNEVFRTQSNGPSTQDRDAASKFFNGSPSYADSMPPNAYDLSLMNRAISGMNIPQLPMPVVDWAADFMVQQPGMSQSSPSIHEQANTRHDSLVSRPSQPLSMTQWTPTFRMNSMNTFAPPMSMQTQHGALSQNEQISWDKEFASHELHPQTSSDKSEQHSQSRIDPDDLARTAGLLLDTIKAEQNPKFKQSQFMELMKQLRDHEVAVDGDKMVPNTEVDVKGKGNAIDQDHGIVKTSPSFFPHSAQYNFPSTTPYNDSTVSFAHEARQKLGISESSDDAYWKEENANYQRFWADAQRPSRQKLVSEPEWGKLQDDWDAFEATASGIKPVTRQLDPEFVSTPLLYQFQENNPYLSRAIDIQHALEHKSMYDSVLELEAAVQQNPSNHTAWFELGVKQQENERERKAIAALERARDLDPSHLPTWLALAVSYTNDGDRSKTYDTIAEWAQRNSRYSEVVQQYLQQTDNLKTNTSEQFRNLTQCLISMATSKGMDDIDADVQIALAILFNTHEDYEKAQDCFRTALAVRPDDWMLYNRVGATMANNGHAEEALQYYYKALELNTGYIRARYNLGISCVNLRMYPEAAQHILDALVLQDADGIKEYASEGSQHGVTSTALWESLKTAFLHMQRADFATLCDGRDLDAIRYKLVSEES